MVNPHQYMDFVAAALEAERGAARMTIEELSIRSGIPERTLYRVLHAQRDIHVTQVRDIAGVFGLPPSAIYIDAERRMARPQPHGGVDRTAQDRHSVPVHHARGSRGPSPE